MSRGAAGTSHDGEVGAPELPRSLRFAIVTTFYPPYNFGGDGIFAERLAHALADRGHQVRVLHNRTAHATLARHPPLGASQSHPRVEVVSLDTPGGAAGLLWLHQSGGAGPLRRWLRRWLDDESYDVIHYNNVSLLGGFAAFRFGRGLKLCTLSDHWLVCPMHSLWRMGREPCTHATCVRCMIHGRRPPQLWRTRAGLLGCGDDVDVFLAPSQSTADEHRRRGLGGEILRLPLFSPTVLPVSAPAPARPYFVFVGRLEPEKGVEDLLAAFRRRPDVDLVIAGAGGLGDRLVAVTRTSRNIRLTGLLAGEALPGLFAGAIATIVPSRCHETFGLVAIESFAAGTPVIVRAHSGLAELVQRHGGGLTFSDAAELDAAIDRLQSDGGLRAELAAQARSAHATEFTEAVFLSRYLELIAARSASARSARAAL